MLEMRSQLFGTFLLVCLVVTSISAQEKTDREKAFLVGPVKTIRSKAVKQMGDKPDGSGSAKDEDTVTYDRAGNEIERIMISDYGFPIGKQNQKYDAQGLLSETVFVNEKGDLQERTTYVYEQGKLTQVLRYDAKRILREKTVRIYDAKGKLTSEVYYDPNTPRAKTLFVYDDKGIAVEMSFFLTDGRKAVAPLGPCFGGHRVVYTYDDRGQVITKMVYDTDGSVKKSWQYQYNEKGLYAEYLQKSVGSNIRHVFGYEYDATGNWIKQTITSETDTPAMDRLFERMGVTEKASPEDAKLLRDMRIRTTVTTREITYY